MAVGSARQFIGGRVGIAEPGLSADIRKFYGAQQCGEIGRWLQRAVEVPELRAFQIIRARVHVAVQRYLVDPVLAFARDGIAQRPGDRDLLLVSDGKTAEIHDSALFERRANLFRITAPEQSAEIGLDLAADARSQVRTAGHTSALQS